MLGGRTTRTRGRSLTSSKARPQSGHQAARATSSTSVDPVAPLDNAFHFEPLKAAEAANGVLHPLLLLAPRSMTTQSVVRAADISP
jgi:hypothetical protein